MYHINFNNPIHVHFIGIGGISMSGLAHILRDKNFTVSGSDAAESALTKELTAAGCHIVYSQTADNITSDIDLVVYTAAIRDTNPELSAARAAGIPTITRAELLGQIIDQLQNRCQYRRYTRKNNDNFHADGDFNGR